MVLAVGAAPGGVPYNLKEQARTLAQQPGLAWLGELAKRDDVDWQKIELASQNWDYQRAGLTREGGGGGRHRRDYPDLGRSLGGW